MKVVNTEYLILTVISVSLTVQAPKVNIALRKKAYQSSTYNQFDAARAVDGNNGTTLRGSSSCAHGYDNWGGPNWLVVDLDVMYRVGQVAVTSRDSYSERLNYFIVGLTNKFDPHLNYPKRREYDICRQYPHQARISQRMVVECLPNTPPRQFVIVQQPPDGYGSLTICELEVYELIEIEPTPFVGCFKRFEDQIESYDTSNMYCINWCLNNTKTYYYINDQICVCGNVPINSGLCDNRGFNISAVCPLGFYGNRCKEMCQCEKNAPCDVDTGLCPMECSKYWTGQNCNHANFSTNGIYMGCMQGNDGLKEITSSGNACLSECRNQGYDIAGLKKSKCWCRHGSVSTTKYCGETNFIDIYAVCPSGTYGFNCSLRCNCKDEVICSYTNGSCPDGCQDGWTGENCNERDCSVNNGLCETNSKCVGGYYRNWCQCIDGYSRLNIHSTCEYVKNSNGVIIALIVLLTLLVLSTILVLLFFFRKKLAGFYKSRDIPNKKHAVRYTSQISTDQLTEESIETNIETLGMKLKLVNFPDFVAANSQTFAEEFKSIPMQTSASCTYGEQKQVKLKNRFRNIIPYDNNRVILKQLPGSELSDYINASYITGYKTPIIIATQGPTQHSVHDFWRMVGEQDVGIIVLLCNIKENDKIKCAMYWPESDDASYGGYKIQFKSKTEWPEFCQRIFKLETPKFVQREVTQLHFTEWPDHGIPENILNFISFRKHFRMVLNKKQCTSLVHCSAGVGRTGCFLAIDYLMEKAAVDEYVDVPGCIRMMRKERPRMVQTQSQYEFIYNCLVVKEIMGDTVFGPGEFLEHFQKTLTSQKTENSLMNQFELILQNGLDFAKHESRKSKKQQSELTGCMELKNLLGNLSFYFTKQCSEDNLMSNIFAKCQTLITFDPSNKLQNIIKDPKSPNNDVGFLILINSKEVDYGWQLIVEKAYVSQKASDKLDYNYKPEEPVYENASYTIPEITIEKFDECHEDPDVQYSRMTSLFRIVVQKHLKGGKKVGVLNLSESDSCGLFLVFCCALETLLSRNEISIYQQVVHLNQQANSLLIKTFSSYKDIYQYLLKYLEKEEKKYVNLI